jgi:hypothetical protein
VHEVEVASLDGRLALTAPIRGRIEHQLAAMLDQVHGPLSALDFGS